MAERVLTRVHSLRERLDATLAAHRNEILLFLSRYGFRAIFLPFDLVAVVCPFSFAWYVVQVHNELFLVY